MMREYIVPINDEGNINMVERELQLQELVRCKDCKHHEEWSCAVCIDEIFETAGNWFCAYGERRADDA